MSWKLAYQEAHERDFRMRYPTTYQDGHYSPPKYPDSNTTNGLTNIVQRFMIWSGHYANRINVAGRMIGGFTRTEAGNVFDDRKWIKSSTRKGSSDLMCAIDGRMICIEIKNKNTRDIMSADQQREKMRVERSGGVYLIVTTVEDFFAWYDEAISNCAIIVKNN